MGGGRKDRSFDRTPVFREMVLVTEEMCSVQLSLSSTITPKNLVDLTLEMGKLSIAIADEGKEGLLDLLKKMHLVLLELRESLFDLNQEETLMSSQLRV